MVSEIIIAGLVLICRAIDENRVKIKKQSLKLSPVYYKRYSADNKLECKNEVMEGQTGAIKRGLKWRENNKEK